MTLLHIGHTDSRSIGILPHYANRHGLIAGATGSGKTKTLETLALGFSKIGTPCFIADVKGDISDDLKRTDAPVQTLDVFGEHGAKLSISPARMGPELLSRLLGLSDVQSGVLDVAFAYAEHDKRNLYTLDDLKALLRSMSGAHRAISAEYGLTGAASIAAIQRGLLRLKGAEALLRAPTYDVADLLEGDITVLHAVRLMRSPSLYAAVLLFILQDLYDRLPEVGDLDRPRLALFLDEAHLLFQDCPAALLGRIERIVRLVRSKGVALFFATQSPADLPGVILGQLGNRIQHGLRGATPADMRSVRAAAESMVANPRFDAASVIGSLGVGEALVSVVGASGIPMPVERVRVDAPVLGEVRAAETVVRPEIVESRERPRGFIGWLSGW